MLNPLTKRFFLTGLAAVGCSLSASGHLGYSGRDFGVFSGLECQETTITGQTVMNWSWADGTDADFMHSHRIKFFRFTLENPTTVTISVASLDPTNLLPAFSLYSGLAHLSPAGADYENPATMAYLATLDGPSKEGAFYALGTWKMGNDDSPNVADFSTFTYAGHAADGTPLNYGNAPGINGDGVADGSVTSSFTLPAGSYTLAVGGANYAGQGTTGAIFEGGHTDANTTLYGFNATVAVVPEPTTSVLIAGGMLFLGTVRRRRATNPVTQQAA